MKNWILYNLDSKCFRHGFTRMLLLPNNKNNNYTRLPSLVKEDDRTYKNSPVDYFSEGAGWRVGQEFTGEQRR
jgi:hypothetical protein